MQAYLNCEKHGIGFVEIARRRNRYDCSFANLRSKCPLPWLLQSHLTVTKVLCSEASNKELPRWIFRWLSKGMPHKQGFKSIGELDCLKRWQLRHKSGVITGAFESRKDSRRRIWDCVVLAQKTNCPTCIKENENVADPQGRNWAGECLDHFCGANEICEDTASFIRSLMTPLCN